MENKQIEEMAKETMKHCKIDNQCGSCHWSTCNECLSEFLYNAGYRKASEVVEEMIECLADRGLLNVEVWGITDLKAELKKKYESEDTK